MRKSELEVRRLMSAHRGSAGSNPAPRNFRAETFAERSARIFLRGQPGTPQHELIASMSLWTTEFPARAS